MGKYRITPYNLITWTRSSATAHNRRCVSRNLVNCCKTVGTGCTINPQQVEVDGQRVRRPSKLHARWVYFNRFNPYGPITIAIRARFEYDSSTIRLQHATTRYEVFRALAYEIDSSTPRESVVGVSCMLIDSSMHTIFTLYLYRPTLHRVCVNMPEIVYTNAIKCQYAEYTIIYCEIILMLKWKTCGHILRAFIA